MAFPQRLQTSVVLMEQEQVGRLQPQQEVLTDSQVFVGLGAAIATTPVVLAETWVL